MKNHSHSFLKLIRAAVLAVVGLSLLTSVSRACYIDMYVYVGGNLVRVVPGSGTFGRVQIVRGEYITDRVARGERMFTLISPSTNTEQQHPGISLSNVRSDTSGQTFGLQLTPIFLPGWGLSGWRSYDFRIPTDPSWSDLHIQMQTTSGLFRQRIPLGARL